MRYALVVLILGLTATGAEAQFWGAGLSVDAEMLAAQSTDEDAVCLQLDSSRSWAVTTIWSAGVSTGVVEVEEGDDDTTDGSDPKSNLATHTTPGASTRQTVRFDGPIKAICTRISTAVVGGTVTTRIIGR